MNPVERLELDRFVLDVARGPFVAADADSQRESCT
jgi:hypothetical protein